jgi:BASS family bile acid:Na+ symporter
LIVVLLFVMVALYPALLSMDSWSYVVIASVSVAALAIGHAFGPQDMHEKASLAIECGVRHPALAITIASANFSPAKAMPVLVPCVITFSALAMVYMLWRGRSLAGQQPAGVTR